MADKPAPTPQPGPPNEGSPQPAFRPQPGYGPPPGYPQPGYGPPQASPPNYGPPQGYPQPGYGPPQAPPPNYGPPQGYPQPGYGPPQAPPPNYGPPQGYPQPGYEPRKKRAGLATAALVLGIVGLIMAIIPFVNFVAYPVVLLAVIFGLLAFRFGKGKAGLILGSLGLVATILWTVAIAGAFNDAVNKNHTVVYEVTGTGSLTHADISYYSNDGSDRSSDISADNQQLPFTKTVTVKGDFSDFDVQANAPISGDGNPSGTLSCRLLVDGKVVSTDRSSGSAQDVMCTGTGYNGS